MPGVTNVDFELRLRFPMSIYSVTIFFSSSIGPATRLQITYHNKLNMSDVVVQKFADNCETVFLDIYFC